MKVKDLILYQVATDQNYKVGDKLTFGEDFNGQGRRVYGTKFNKNEKALHQIGFKYADSKNIFKNKDIVIEMSKALSESDFVLRELALEEVRVKKFPHLPSRLKCMFLSETKQTALNNLQNFYDKKGFGSQYQAVAVKLNGELFYARSAMLVRDGLSYNQYREIAEKYWAQDQNSAGEVREILFIGQAEIVEILGEKQKN